MPIRSMQENEISKSLIRNPEKLKPKEFIAYLEDGKWQVKFTYNGDCCELRIKRKGVKRFACLTTLSGCLNSLGVKEFKVLL